MLVAAGATEHAHTILSLTAIMAAALLSPLLSYVTGKRIPAVVIMLALGVVIGPEMLGLAELGTGIEVLRELGLGMLFLLAGFEINVRTLTGKQGRNAIATWFACLLIAFLAAALVLDSAFLTAATLAIAVTSTALGTLMPILKSTESLPEDIKEGVMIHGAVGELLPIMAIAIVLSTRSTWVTLVVIALFFFIALLVAFVPRTVAAIVPWISRAFIDGASATNQTVVRMVILLLLILMSVAAVFQLDVVLGAFAAGIILRTLVPKDSRPHVEKRLDVVGYGFLIPIFFICSGMAISVKDVAQAPWGVLVVVGVILVARGMPIFLHELFRDTGSGIKDAREKLQLGLYSATGLPIIVAVTEVATKAELLSQQRASILVAGGAATVLIFPLLAAALQPKSERSL
ncbi:MAG TPA: cation:proton antiporter [Candidatus Corynebacterium gallistercoris]|uniref:Cation:proton antiporter n=1 Tax=Candidatus Corynebacterium gallistercoris TaxID=2838530 RepID=A0A9D1UPM3_9CORY|nr:cation:proton antiporter [Candidatus Corynebacterium gallistercoris]